MPSSYSDVNIIPPGTVDVFFSSPLLYLVESLCIVCQIKYKDVLCVLYIYTVFTVYTVYVYTYIYMYTHRHPHEDLLISKCISPYLAAAPSSERLTLLGGSRARLVRTPQAEKHISVLFESSSVTTNWCTEGERAEKDDGMREQTKTKQGKDKRDAITRVSRHVYTGCSWPWR